MQGGFHLGLAWSALSTPCPLQALKANSNDILKTCGVYANVVLLSRGESAQLNGSFLPFGVGWATMFGSDFVDFIPSIYNESPPRLTPSGSYSI